MSAPPEPAISGALRAAPALRALSDGDIEVLASICSLRTFPAGARLMTQGDACDRAFVVIGGQVEVAIDVDGARESIANLGPGELVGELGLVAPGERSAHVMAVVDTEAVELPGDRFGEMRAALEPAAFRLVREIARLTCERLADINRRIDEAHHTSSDEADPMALTDPGIFAAQSPAESGPRVEGVAAVSDSNTPSSSLAAVRSPRVTPLGARTVLARLWNAPEEE